MEGGLCSNAKKKGWGNHLSILLGLKNNHSYSCLQKMCRISLLPPPLPSYWSKPLPCLPWVFARPPGFSSALSSLLWSMSYFLILHFPHQKHAKHTTTSTKAVLPPPVPQPSVAAPHVLGGLHCPEPSAPVTQGPAAPSVCLSPRAPSESTHCRMTPACRPLPGSFGNYLTASHRNARLGFTLFEA